MKLKVETELKNYKEREYPPTFKAYTKIIKVCMGNCYQTDADL